MIFYLINIKSSMINKYTNLIEEYKNKKILVLIN